MEFEVDQLVEFAMPNGETLAGRILEIGDDAVKVDFNHPLADLYDRIRSGNRPHPLIQEGPATP
jgi:hypothetical protein